MELQLSINLWQIWYNLEDNFGFQLYCMLVTRVQRSLDLHLQCLMIELRLSHVYLKMTWVFTLKEDAYIIWIVIG